MLVTGGALLLNKMAAPLVNRRVKPESCGERAPVESNVKDGKPPMKQRYEDTKRPLGDEQRIRQSLSPRKKWYSLVD